MVVVVVVVVKIATDVDVAMTGVIWLAWVGITNSDVSNMAQPMVILVSECTVIL